MVQLKQMYTSFPSWIFYVLTTLIAVYLSFHFYAQSLITIEAPERDHGEKVIITLPDGREIFTYENYIFEEDGKLYYQGERNTIEFTDGFVVFENWP